MRSYVISGRISTAVSIAVALALLTADARANGRFPAATQLVVDPAAEERLVLRSTYGLLQSFDRAGAWRWVCEPAVGYGLAYDPAIAVSGDGTILAGLADGVALSGDRGCTWGRGGGPLEGAYVIDLAVDAPRPHHVVAVTTLPNAVDGARGTFAESFDDGRTWRRPGELLPENFRAVTVDVSAADPRRVYASGRGDSPVFGVIVRSDDGGATWSEAAFDFGGATPYVAAIDPANRDRVFVRLRGASADAVALSEDGAVTWRTIFKGKGSLRGFALSPDGAEIAVGGPADGLYVAGARDLKFASASSLGVGCLTWGAAGLFACADERADGFGVGLSRDHGRSFVAAYHPADLLPLVCAAGTVVADVCPALWPAARASLTGPDAGADAGDLDGRGPTEPRNPAAPRMDTYAAGGGCGVGPSASADAPFPAAIALVLAAIGRAGVILRRRVARPTAASRRDEPRR